MRKNVIGLGLLGTLLLLAIHPAFATPAEVLILRHAEKPEEGADLNDRGYARAQALVSYFAQRPEARDYGKPVAIYAAPPRGPSSSRRSVETATPLAKALGLPLKTSFFPDQTDGLAQEILANPAYEGHTVVVVWAHQYIPDIAEALGADSAPAQWDSGAFDRVWKIRFDATGKVTQFEDLPQRLLPGDSEN